MDSIIVVSVEDGRRVSLSEDVDDDVDVDADDAPPPFEGTKYEFKPCLTLCLVSELHLVCFIRDTAQLRLVYF